MAQEKPCIGPRSTTPTAPATRRSPASGSSGLALANGTPSLRPSRVKAGLVGLIAQLVEQWIENPRVAGSIPAKATMNTPVYPGVFLFLGVLVFWGSTPDPALLCRGFFSALRYKKIIGWLFVLGFHPRPRAPLSRLFFFAALRKNHRAVAPLPLCPMSAARRTGFSRRAYWVNT